MKISMVLEVNSKEKDVLMDALTVYKDYLYKLRLDDHTRVGKSMLEDVEKTTNEILEQIKVFG